MEKVGKAGVCILLGALGAIFLFSSNVQAAGHLLINEIYSAPASGGKEWVELYNPTTSALDLSVYSLMDGSGDQRDLDGSIGPGSYIIYESNNSWLNNPGDILFLLSSEQIVDKVAYGNWKLAVLANNADETEIDNAPVMANCQSISRIPDGTDTDDDKLDFKVVPKTPGTENILPIYSDQIKINEIVPQPLNGPAFEYIELYNAGQESIELDGWSIDDSEGGSTPYPFPKATRIEPGGYLTVYSPNSGISLNDSGDAARLIDPNGDVKDQIIYQAGRKGYSYSKISEAWLWSLALTPDAQNEHKEEALIDETNPILTISELKSKEIGEDVITEGVISVTPGVLSRQYFYIEDSTGGIQVYLYSGDFPLLKRGMKLKVTGEISNYYGETRVKISSPTDFTIMEENAPSAAADTSSREIGEEDVGRFVKTSGVVTTTSGDVFIISGSPRLKVIIKEGTGINKPKMKKGDRVGVSGIVSIYKGELRLLPIAQDGVMILTSGRLPVTGDDLWNTSLITAKRPLKSWPTWPANFVAEMLWPYTEIWVAAKPQV